MMGLFMNRHEAGDGSTKGRSTATELARTPTLYSRATLVVIFAATLLALAFGFWVFRPYLINEHRRISPWLWIPMWLGDLTALFWFVAAIVRPRRSIADCMRTRAETRRRRLRAFVLTMGLALAADFAHTAYAHWKEASDFASATVVPGVATAVRTRAGTDTTRYFVTVRFRDSANQVHEETIRVQSSSTAGLPGAARDALGAGRVPFPISVSYEEGRASRCWLTDAGWDDGDRIYLMSYLVLLFQAIGVACFAVFLREQYGRDIDPWWDALERPLPLIITGAFCILFGLAELVAGNLTP
jgi:hypothetical protein